MKKLQHFIQLLAVVLAASILIGFAYLLLFCPIKAIYSIDAQIERVEYTTIDDNIGRYVLYGAQIKDYDDTLYSDFHGSLEIKAGVTIAINRIMYEDIYITMDTDSRSVGTLYDDSGATVIDSLPSYIELIITGTHTKIKTGLSQYFTIDGDATIGTTTDRHIYGDVPMLLKSGKVTVLGRSYFGNNYFETSERSLHTGDMVRFITKDHTNEDKKGHGFVLIDEHPGMTLSYRRKAHRTKILKNGPKTDTSSYDLTVSALDRILYDKIFQGLSLVVTFCMIIVQLINYNIDRMSYHLDKDKHTNV